MKAIQSKYLFHGVHVPDRKSLASSRPIEPLAPAAVLELALAQGIGKPAVPVVAVGETVKQGQLIARQDGLGAALHAPVSGVVRKIEGSIVLENDGKYETAYLPPLEQPTPDAVLRRIADAGIVGMGGAGFPTAVKLAPQDKVDVLLVNGAECEPYLTCDDRLMTEHAREIAEGARLIATALGVDDIRIGIEANKPHCAAAFEAFDFLQPIVLKKQYPVGSEKHLIYACTGRKVPTGKLPAAVGCIVQNVATCFAVYEAVTLGKPLIERVVTVSGEAIEAPKNLLVRIGTPYAALIEACGLTDAAEKIVCGGPMTGKALANLDGFVTKTTGGIVALTRAGSAPTACIGCGKCADVCPMHLMPMHTAFYTAAGDYAMAAKQGGVLNCIECGACAYICPAHRPLIQSIRKAKAELRKGGNS